MTYTTALANFIDALRKEQVAEGFTIFTLSTEDRISMNDVKIIVDALRAHGDSAPK